jgi:hypothetical protein
MGSPYVDSPHSDQHYFYSGDTLHVMGAWVMWMGGRLCWDGGRDRPARAGFNSTYRAAASRYGSSMTNDANRPCHVANLSQTTQFVNTGIVSPE